MIGIDDVTAAQRRIGNRVRRTPILRAGPQLWFKLEHTQHAGSFKTRGMFHQILAAAERGALPPAGIVTASGGNAGLAAAYAARELGVAAEVFTPATAPPVKVAKLRKLGARVVQAGTEYADAYTHAVAAAETSGALFCHAYDDLAMVAGNGTIGLELAEQLPGGPDHVPGAAQRDGFDTVLVAVGGGGLIAGVIAALRDRARVVAVEPITSAALAEALRAGEPVDVPVSGVAADSLGARRAGRIAFELARDAGVGSVLVDDKAIVDARRRLWEDYRLAVEHGTAAALAAVTSGAYLPAPGERIVLLLCGANTDPSDLAG